MRLFRRPRGRIFLSFGAMQAMQLALPLLALPWLGRALGPDHFGLLMYMCVFPPIINLVMEWGLPLGAARTAAREKRHAEKLRSLLGAALSAKILLACACSGIALLCMPFLPYASQWPGAFFLAILAGMARGISPLWFFQGTGRAMGKMAAFDVGGSLLALALIFAIVRNPSDWPHYLLITAACKGGAFLYLNFSLWRDFRPRLSLNAAIALLHGANALFACSFFNMVCLYGTQLVLGWFLSAPQMGIYVAVNKMVRAMASLANPIAQTMYPRICALGGERPGLARRILFFSIALAMLGMAAATAAAWLLAPWLIGAALGAKYTQAVPVFRVMALAAPLLACDAALSSQALAAFNLERRQAVALGVMAAASLGIAAALSIEGSLNLAAWTPFCVEAGVLASYLLLFRRASRQAPAA